MGQDEVVQIEPGPAKWIEIVMPEISCRDGLIIRRDVRDITTNGPAV
jgi:hypothetical protein